MRTILLILSCVVAGAQTPTIALNQIRSNVTPPQFAIPFVGNSAGTLINYDISHLFWDSANLRVNMQGALFLNLTGGGTQCLHVSNTGILSGFAADCTPAPTQASTAALWTGTECSTGTNALLVNGNCGAGSGGTAFGYFALTKTSSTIDTVGSDCGISTPCNAQVGDSATAARPIQFTNSCTAVLASGSATWSIYIDSAGNLDVGTAGTGTLSGASTCNPTTLAAGVLFPPGSIPLYTHTSLSGAWISNGVTDYRSPVGNKPNTVGSGGILCSGNTCSPDSTVIGILANSNTCGATQTFNNAVCGGTCTGFGGGGSSRAEVIPIEVACQSATAYGIPWSWQSTNVPSGGVGSAPTYCPNSSDAYQGGFVAFSDANTNVASFNVPVPPWWTTGTVTVNMWVLPTTGGSGNVQFQASTYCTTTSTVFGSGQTYNTANLTNLITAPTANHYYLLTVNLTMTGCSGGSPLSVLVQQTGSNTWTAPDYIGHSAIIFN